MDWFDAIAAQGSRWLTEWEIDFTASIASKLGDVGRELSEKQVACIDKLLYRAFMRGVRP